MKRVVRSFLINLQQKLRLQVSNTQIYAPIGPYIALTDKGVDMGIVDFVHILMKNYDSPKFGVTGVTGQLVLYWTRHGK